MKYLVTSIHVSVFPMTVSIVFSVLYWAVGLIIFTSLIEHQVHKHLMHKQNFLSARIDALERTFKHHAIQHHGQYRQTFVDESVPLGTDRGIRLNLKEGFFEGMLFALVLLPFSWVGAALFPFVICLHHFLWNQIHLEMHKPEQRGFAHWSLYKFLARHHYLHHRYPAKNFNVVVPFADFILGTAAKASAEDTAAMQALGMY